MCWIPIVLDYLSKIGALLSGVGILWVAKGYWEQKKQNKIALRIQALDRFHQVFEEANDLFSPVKLEELVTDHQNQDWDRNRRSIFLLDAAVFFEKIDFAISLATELKDSDLVSKFSVVAKASFHQIQSIAAIDGRKFELSNFPRIKSIVNA